MKSSTKLALRTCRYGDEGLPGQNATLFVASLHRPLTDVPDCLATIRAPVRPAKLKSDRLHGSAFVKPDVSNVLSAFPSEHARREQDDDADVEPFILALETAVHDSPAQAELRHRKPAGLRCRTGREFPREWRSGRLCGGLRGRLNRAWCRARESSDCGWLRGLFCGGFVRRLYRSSVAVRRPLCGWNGRGQNVHVAACSKDGEIDTHGNQEESAHCQRGDDGPARR